MTVKPPKRQSRRGIETFNENPFVKTALVSTTTGSKKLTNKTGDKFMIVSSETGELIAPAGFHEIVQVDKTQFVKLYLNGVKAFKGLTNPGIKVFEIIYMNVQDNPGADTVYLHFAAVNQDSTPISESTFFRGMKELISKNFIAESILPGQYYINIDYIFNGNRLAFLKEYQLKEDEKKI